MARLTFPVLLLLHVALFASFKCVKSSEFDNLLTSAKKVLNCAETNQRDKENCFIKLGSNYFERFTLCALTSDCLICNESNRTDLLTQWYRSNNYTSVNEAVEDLAVNLFVWTYSHKEFCTKSVNLEKQSVYVDHVKQDGHFQEGLEHWFHDALTELNKNRKSRGSKCETDDAVYKESGITDSTPNKDSAIKTLSFISVAHYLNDYEIVDGVCLPSIDAIMENLYAWMKVPLNGTVPQTAVKTIMEKLELNSAGDVATTEDPHEGHNHKRKKRSTLSDFDNVLHREKRADDHDHSTEIIPCLTDEQIMKMQNANQNGLTRDQFRDSLATLVQQKVTDACVKNESSNQQNLSNAQKYGYGTLSVFLISLCSVLGILVISCGKNKFYSYFLYGLIAMGVGAIFGDTMMHLIPETLGVHVHGSITQEVPDNFYKMIVILLTLWIMFNVELLMTILSKNNLHDDNNTSSMYITEVKSIEDQPTADSYQPPNLDLSNDYQCEDAPKNTLAAALMVIIGDTIHNFADGLAIGAAFTVSISSGVSTSIAVFCHELPHEFSDFAVLLSAGFTWRKALMWNILSALSSFVGLWIGISVSANEDVRRWIFCVTIGIFLYVALADMLPSLKERRFKRKWLTFAAQNIGFIVGLLAIMLLTVYEENIRVSIG